MYEQAIRTKLEKLDCTITDFCKIAKSCGLDAPRSTLTFALAGDRTLDHDTGKRLHEFCEELELARDYLGERLPGGLPLDWGKTERVCDLRILALFKKVSEENEAA